MGLLTNLFKLDGEPLILRPGDKLPAMSPDDTVQNVVFQHDIWPAPHRTIRAVTFRNVAISKCVTRVTFTDCIFEDCLFLGSHFQDVELHNCRFQNCNFWKAKFERVYLDPATLIFDRRFRIEAANVGISVFHALLSNFADERQDEFYMEADARFRRWKRYQIWHELRRKRLGLLSAWARWLSSVSYEHLAGFGYRPLRFFIATMILFSLVSLANHFLISDAVTINGVQPDYVTFSDTLFYSFSILTVLGFSSIVPTHTFAKLLTVFEALLAIGWLGIFTSVLVKRFLR